MFRPFLGRRMCDPFPFEQKWGDSVFGASRQDDRAPEREMMEMKWGVFKTKKIR